MSVKAAGAVSYSSDDRVSSALVAFAERLALSDIPVSVRETAKLHLLDTVGVALAAASMRDLSGLTTSLSALAAGDCRIPGMDARLAVRDAALVFGMQVHGIEFDDTSVYGRLHPSAFCAPAALTLGANRNASGKSVLAAYVAGIETAIRLGAAARGGISEIGFDPTGVIGVVGASVVSAKLLNLQPEQFRRALSFAYSLSSGNMEYLSGLTSTKSLNAGAAAANGITASVLASTDLSAPQNPFDGKFGLYALYARGASTQADIALATDRFGEHWVLADDLAYKPLPLCFFSIPAADAAIQLATRHDINPTEISHIVVRIPQASITTIAEPAALRRRPTHRYAAQFSIYFAVACGLARRRISIDDLEDSVLDDTSIRQLIDKTVYEADMNTTFPSYYSAELVVTMMDGEQYALREAVHRGSPKSTFNRENVIAKFEDNATRILTVPQMRLLKEAVMAIDELDDTRTLAELYSPDIS